MFETLVNIDTALFRLFNTSLANPLFDLIMPVITNETIWALPMLGILLYLLIKGGKRGRIAGVILIVTVVLTDATTARILKPFFGRLRPSHELTEGIRLLMGKGGKFGFVSSHAANIFGAAVVLNYFYPRCRKIFFTVAVLVAFSRVYIGVHYPADIVFGGLYGYGIAWAILSLWMAIRLRELKRGADWMVD